MAELHFHGNNCYFEVDGTDFSPDWMDMSLTSTNEGQDLTAGAGRTGMQRGDGLYDVSGSATFMFNNVDTANRLKGLRAGKHTIIICPKGNISGEPKHAGSMRISSTALDGQSVSKTPVNVAIQLEQADEPLIDIFNGGTV